MEFMRPVRGILFLARGAPFFVTWNGVVSTCAWLLRAVAFSVAGGASNLIVSRKLNAGCRTLFELLFELFENFIYLNFIYLKNYCLNY